MFAQRKNEQEEKSADSTIDSVYREGEGFIKTRSFRIMITCAVLGGFLGLIAFSYQKGKDSGSDITVATIEPATPYTRIKPEDPSGMQIPHQDMQVYSRIDPQGVERPSIERLTPPPELPVVPQALREESTSALVEEIIPEDSPIAVEAEPQYIAPLSNAPQPQAAAPKAATAAPAPAEEKAPPPAPQQAATPAPAPTPAPAAAQPTTQAPAASGGSFRIQLLASKDKSAVDASWQSIKTKHNAILGNSTQLTENVTINGEQYYRLQAGSWNTQEAAATVCNNLKKAGQDCMVVKR